MGTLIFGGWGWGGGWGRTGSLRGIRLTFIFHAVSSKQTDEV